jgi:pimeloyl-ACP methyl ester carboxylesterase
LTVPKDYDDAAIGTFDLAVVRLPATGQAEDRIGTLFFNPGGPGESGVSLATDVASAIPLEVRARFDFVTWDPRGVGGSAGLEECQGGQYQLPATGEVDWDAVTAAMRDTERAANEQCAERYPDVVPYISTRSTVRDLDQIRAAVGDEELTYWGTSYGTRIGYVYAYEYPERVRAMLLTSPVDPNATWQSFAFGSATSPDNAVGFFFQAMPGAEQNFDDVLSALADAPLVLPSGAQVTQWDVRGLVANGVTSQGTYQDTAEFIDLVDVAIEGSGQPQAEAVAALDEMEWPTSYPINGGATAFIGCLDYPQRLTADEQNDLAARIRGQAPVFGFGASQGLFFCEGVDVTPDPVPVDFTNTVTPMLIMGSTRDALTQYEWATDLARNFRNSRVVSYVGTVHTPFLGAGSPCVDALGVDYLINLNRPATDVSCPYQPTPPAS